MHIDMTHQLGKRRILSADRQAEFRKRMTDAGMVQVSGWVSGRQASGVAQLIRRLRDDSRLEVGPVRDTRTGKLAKLER